MRELGYTMKEIAESYYISRQAVSARLLKGMPKMPGAFGSGIFGKRRNKAFQGRNRVREFVRMRDKYTCQDCGLERTREEVDAYNSKLRTLKGMMKSLDIHHLNGECGKNSRGYDSIESVAGLITLCHSCHFNRPDHSKKSKMAHSL